MTIMKAIPQALSALLEFCVILVRHWKFATGLMLALLWSAATVAQQTQTQCYAATFAQFTGGAEHAWSGQDQSFTDAAQASFATDHDCWSDGAGGCQTLTFQGCNPAGNPSATQLYAFCLVTGSGGVGAPQGVQLTIQVDAGQVPCLYSITATPPPMSSPCKDCMLDPINPATGSVYAKEDDFAVAGGSSAVEYSRYYNSADPTGIDGVPGWRHSYGRSIFINFGTITPYLGESPLTSPQYTTPQDACVSGFAAIQGAVPAWAGATAAYNNGSCTILSGNTTIGTAEINYGFFGTPPADPVEYDAVRDDGQIIRFTLQNGVINSQPGVSLRLVQAGSGFTLTDDQDNVEVYNAAGVLQSITSRAGIIQTISYDPTGLLSGVTDSFGNSLAVSRNAQGAIASVSLSGGNTVQYIYDTLNRLITVTNADNTTQHYVYGNTTFPNALTAKIDENGTTFSTWTYDSQERATATQEMGGVEAGSLTYNSDGSVTTTDALGAVRTFNFQRVGDANAVVGISGSQCATCEDSAATTYDIAGYVNRRTDYNGNVTCYAHDPVRGVELIRVEGFAPGSTCPTNLSTYTPASGTIQRKVTTQWNPTWTEPSLITEPTRTTAFTFDSSGDILTKTITDTTVSPNVSRAWAYTYNGFGQVLTVKGPRTDVADITTYAYYTCTSGYQCGHLQSVTDSLGHITTFNSYNAYGQPLTVTDPNSVLTTLAYDARQRLTSRQDSSETTTFSYWPTGTLKTVTSPDGSDLRYTYDEAHRLIQVADGAGNTIAYTLDNLGNWTVQSAYDPSNALARTQSRTFNSVSELYQQIAAAGTSAVTTTFGYDGNGNQTSIAAPLSRNTTKAFDALNRLSQVTDPNSGVTRFTYDASDGLVKVVDPRSLTTTYTNNGFGQMIAQGSPDTGTTTVTYDSGGNIATKTDARSDTGTYTYDSLNRATRISYLDQVISFGYDSGANGVGRLTSASDANHSMSWSYDSLGRVVNKTQTVGTLSHSVGYTYTNGDMTSLTTPSGQTVNYSYSNGQVVGITVNGTALLNNITYEPFGPVSGWTWGNGTTTVRGYNADGNVSQINAGGENTSYGYDDALRIKSATNTTNAAYSWAYGYDALDRLTSAAKGSFTESWTYDADGNRLTQGGTDSSTFTPASTSNRLSSYTGWVGSGSPTYDPAGHVTQLRGGIGTYNNAGQVATINFGASTQYTYNALGQRVRKSVAGAVTDFMYDESDHLLGEYDGSGNLVEETIWLGETPVATVAPNGSGGVAINYIHTDQLNAPRKISLPSSNQLLWRWDSDPFGIGDLANDLGFNQNPSGLGVFTYYPFGFPGQYFDYETTLFHNGARDYASVYGIYLQSDPIGLYGGSSSTYTYARNNPISNIDPKGQSVEIVVPIVIVAYTCYELYCITKGIHGCVKKYPHHTDPLSSDYAGFAQCQKAVVTVCASMGAFGQDPLGNLCTGDYG
jgi:RHS repeat-associated protein